MNIHIKQIIKGFIKLNLFMLPFSIFMMIWMLAAGSSSSASVLFIFVPALFIYGLQIALIGFHVITAKLFELIFRINKQSLGSINVISIGIAMCLFTIWFSIYVDNGFAFKQGNIGLYVYCFALLTGYWAAIIGLGKSYKIQ